LLVVFNTLRENRSLLTACVRPSGNQMAV
jgi:hypothetical protein